MTSIVHLHHTLTNHLCSAEMTPYSSEIIKRIDDEINSASLTYDGEKELNIIYLMGF